jgi:uracil-DNA glycosylase
MKAKSFWKIVAGDTLPTLVDLIPPSWRNHLADLEDHLVKIEREIEGEVRRGKQVLPDKRNVFAALALEPQSVKVVIVGQDPYPDRRYAIGRSFAVSNQSTQLPPSLKNIFREKLEDVGGDTPSADLMQWQRQGVLLLNRTLTVNEGESNSHQGFGWAEVTNRICKISAEFGAAAILWGKNAGELSYLFNGRVIKGVHPSPLSAHRGFFGSKPFSRVNELLDSPITW